MIIFVLLIPLVIALMVFFTSQNTARTLALLGTIANLGLSGWMIANYNTSDGNYAYEYLWPWIASAGINFHLGADGIGLLMVLLTNLLTVFIISSNWGQEKAPTGQYYGLVLLMQTALLGVFTALDGLLFYVFWELALLPISLICVRWGGENKLKTTLKFFLYTFVGSLFMLVSLLYVYLQTPGNHSMYIADLYAVQLTPATAFWVLLGFFLAFAIKMPVFPFHTWQPDTYTMAPTGGTMLLSGIMLKMGVYGVIRWMLPIAPEGWSSIAPFFVFLAVVGIIYASIIAIQQTDFKRLIAYSSIAHVGVIAAGVFAANPEGLQGGLIQMLNHGINIVGLFFIGHIIEQRLNTRNLANMGGIAQNAPKFAAMFMIILLGSVAIPLTNGFVGEFLLLNGLYIYKPLAALFAGLTIILCAVYMLRVYQLAMFGHSNAATANFEDVKNREFWVLSGICFLVLLLGVYPQPILNLTESSVQKILLLAK